MHRCFTPRFAPPLHLCLYIYTPSESFLYEITLWSLVFSETGSGFVNAPGIFAHAGSAMTESHYDFSAYAAYRCISVLHFVLFSLLALSLILVDDVQICSKVSVVWFYLLSILLCQGCWFSFGHRGQVFCHSIS